MNPFHLTLTDKIDKADDIAVREGLNGYYDAQGVPLNWLPLGIFLYDEHGVLAGGLTGGTYWGWLYVARLWIAESARRQGYGTQMMRAAEEEALRRGCHHATLETHDALGFYQKLGYTVYGALENMPTGRTRYSLKKLLPSDH
ncbi:MAG TPA: GNAT family N-acetyltransferase [Anaerolineaceae bacterium]|nr:GNAT family N-acetyltransferase [Anaerolineaceae bacterium]